MKRKILSLVLAICLVIPAIFALSACGKEKSEPVSEGVWFKAWLSVPANYSIIGGVSESDPDYSEYYFAEDGLRMYTPNITQSGRQEGFVKVENGVYTRYTKTDSGEWMAQKSNSEDYAMQKTMTNQTYLGFMDKYESFVVTKNGFKSKGEITTTVTGSPYTFHYFDVVINVDENNKITSATWKQKMTIGEQSTYDYNMTLSVGNVSITYPTATLISENDWADVLNFKNYAPATLTLTYLDEGYNYTIKYDGANLFVNSVSDDVEFNSYYIKDGDSYYHKEERIYEDDYTESNGFYYNSDEYFTAEEYFNIDVEPWLNYADIFLCSEFTYNSATKQYEANSTYQADVYEMSNVKISFVNGKCVEATYTQDDTNYKLEIAYGPVEITIPTIEEN